MARGRRRGAAGRRLRRGRDGRDSPGLQAARFTAAELRLSPSVPALLLAGKDFLISPTSPGDEEALVGSGRTGAGPAD